MYVCARVHIRLSMPLHTCRMECSPSVWPLLVLSNGMSGTLSPSSEGLATEYSSLDSISFFFAYMYRTNMDTKLLILLLSPVVANQACMSDSLHVGTSKIVLEKLRLVHAGKCYQTVVKLCTVEALLHSHQVFTLSSLR